MAMVLEPPAIPGVGTANGVTMVLEDLEGQGVAYLHEQVQRFQEAASRRPEIALCIDMMMADMPQKYVNLDKEKCKFHKVDIDVANGILASYNGSSFINYFNAFGQQWQVYIQAQGEDRASLEKMDGFFVTNADGARVPLSALVNIREIEDTEFVMHHNIYNAAKLNVMPRPGHSTQQVMDALKEVFHQTMDPTKVGFDYQDMSFQENKVRNSIGLGAIFTMSAVFAFLILVALYEKWSLPLAVFLTVPIAVLGAYAGLFWQGMELTLYAPDRSGDAGGSGGPRTPSSSWNSPIWRCSAARADGGYAGCRASAPASHSDDFSGIRSGMHPPDAFLRFRGSGAQRYRYGCGDWHGGGYTGGRFSDSMFLCVHHEIIPY